MVIRRRRDDLGAQHSRPDVPAGDASTMKPASNPGRFTCLNLPELVVRTFFPAIKSSVPAAVRRWRSDSKCWEVSSDWAGPLVGALRNAGRGQHIDIDLQ